MTLTELHEKDFTQAAEELSEQNDCITSYETLKEFAKKNIDEDNLFLAIHILSAINSCPAEYYDYDFCMGTLDKPTALLVISDLEDYCMEDTIDETF